MKKKKSKRKNKLPAMYNKLYPILLIIATLFMGIGYAAIESISLGISGDVVAIAQEGIVILSAKPSALSQTGTGTIISSSSNILNSKVILENNVNSTMTFEITIYNNINDSQAYSFEGVVPDGYDKDFYTNKYIEYDIDGLEVGDVLKYKDEVTFTITFKYVDNVDFSASGFSNELVSYLQFKFKEYAFISDKYGAQQYVVPENGYYLLEAWGGSGYSYSEEYHGGYGGYSTGKVYLEKGTVLYIYIGGHGVGGQGNTDVPVLYAGGYNGGAQGRISSSDVYAGGGGGASHIALSKGANANNGQLRDMENYLDDLLLVAGGGGSVYYDEGDNVIIGGHGGGIEGSSGVNVVGNVTLATGGTQTAGGKQQGLGYDGKFGRGTSYNSRSGIGAGGGLWGGGSGWTTSAGGGSGYIANSRLLEKHMAIYDENAIISSADETRTITVDSYSSSPISDVAKSGDGYVRISYLGEGTEYISILGINYPLIKDEPNLSQPTSVSGESGLYRQYTSSGGTTYYFRGSVDNNYVQFANMLWRIVRVNEDGTLRLILQNGFEEPVNASVFNPNADTYNDMYYSNTNLENGAMYKVENWYENNIGNNTNYSNKVVNGNYFCEQLKVAGVGATMGNAIAPDVNNYNPSFDCNTDGNGKGYVNASVGLITYDELVFAGAVLGRSNANTSYYLYNGGELAWTMSPSGIGADSQQAQVWRIDDLGNINSGDVDLNRVFRPVINLRADVKKIEGNGLKETPIVIE